MKRLTWIRASALAVLVAGVACAAAAAWAGQPDGWITAKVKTSLLTAPDVPGLPIDVDTYDGRVTLAGKVQTPEQRRRAEVLALRVSGVRDVRNLIQVVPKTMARTVRVEDRTLAQRVRRALHDDRDLANSHIGVKSVNRGTVLLAGTAASAEDEARALELAQRTAGVERVASEIQVRERGEENEYASRRLERSRSRDAWLTTQVKLKYLTDRAVPAGSVNVDTWHGRVTLFGRVPSPSVRALAAREALSVKGVQSVDNQLVVVPQQERREVRQQDNAIRSAVHARLSDANLEDANIHVSVAGGVVQLSGTVRDPQDRLTAVTVARSTDGVRGVRDDLHEEATKRAAR